VRRLVAEVIAELHDHVLLALFEDPSIEVVLGVSLQQARQALSRSITKPWAPWAWGPHRRPPTADAPPCRRSRRSETSCKKIASA